MPGHEEGCADKQGFLRTEEAVCYPAAGVGAQVERGTVGADECGGLRLIHAQAALGGGGIEVVGEQCLHAVEAETFPGFHTGDGRQSKRNTRS